MRLGIDSFSVRSQGWNARQVIDYAAGLGLENVHFSERNHIGGIEPSNLESVRDYAGQRHLTIELGMRSFNRLSTTFDPSLGTGEQQLIDMVAAAVVVGSPIVRCFAGMQADRAGQGGYAAFLEESIRTLRAAAPHAEAAGISIAVENHGGVDFLAPELRHLIESVGSSHVRVCLDTGNPVYAAEDAVYAAEILAPYVVTCHLRDTRCWMTPEGAMAQWVPSGRGNLDIGKIVSLLHESAPDIAVDIEDITGGEPRVIPIYDRESDFWKLYPGMSAYSLARFLDTARDGQPEPVEQLVPAAVRGPGQSHQSADQAEALRRQQLDHFEESVRHLRQFIPVSRGGTPLD